MAHGHFGRCTGYGKCKCEIKRYWIIAFINLSTLILEVSGGMISKSIALLSDSVHVGFDLSNNCISLVIAYYVFLHFDDGNKTNKMRARGGVISSIMLFVMVGIVFKTTIEKMMRPNLVQSDEMIIFSVVGLIGNAIALWILEGHHEKNVTHLWLSAHVLSDLVQSIGVVVAGIAIYFTKWQMLDPITSLIMSLLLFRIAVKTFRQSWQSRHSS